ncbi:single-stranded DNA-binding protein [Cupriavidus pauculus]|uniref:single-stranded DNA-binding protein n=1 Tax=Cupriavidus pauculus TaxID=82633 RepID=UPI001EE3490A|nr:single-stranded DNA-binding protein [Cupriavidus pauculus]GJG94127.1 single-stranded DNA-binding protein [Cupriavidus pauculus]
MIDGLVGGKVYGKSAERQGQGGTAYVTTKVLAPASDGESLFVNVIAFNDEARAALLALDDGDSVALSGTLTPKVWTDKNGDTRPALDMVAHAVLTPYHINRKREAVQQQSPSTSADGLDDRSV